MTALAHNHCFLRYTSDIKDICSPLKQFGISHFTYLKNFLEGKQVYLSNHAKWIEDYYRLKLFNSSWFESPPEKYEDGVSYWSTKFSNSEVLQHGRQYFNSDHGITMISKCCDGCEFFFFSTYAQNYTIVNFYLNSSDILKKFIRHFKYNAEKILSAAEKNKIKVIKKTDQIETSPPWQVNPNFPFGSSIDLTKAKEKFLSQLNDGNPNKKSLSNLNNLTPKELEVIKHMCKGLTAKETGNILKISSRTVETHFEHIKDKLNCRTKLELLAKISKNN